MYTLLSTPRSSKLSLSFPFPDLNAVRVQLFPRCSCFRPNKKRPLSPLKLNVHVIAICFKIPFSASQETRCSAAPLQRWKFWCCSGIQSLLSMAVIHTSPVEPLPRQLCGRCPVRILARTPPSLLVSVIFRVLSSSALSKACTIAHVARILSPSAAWCQTPLASFTKCVQTDWMDMWVHYLGRSAVSLLGQLADVGIVCCRNMRDLTSCRLAGSFCLDCSIVKKKVIWSSETSEYSFLTTRRNISEELNLQQRRCVDLRPLSEVFSNFQCLQFLPQNRVSLCSIWQPCVQLLWYCFLQCWPYWSHATHKWRC